MAENDRREILTLQLGQGGNQLGAKFWGSLCHDHSVDLSGKYFGTKAEELERINVYFNEDNGKYVPRTVLVDSEPDTLQSIRASHENLFRPENYVSPANRTTTEDLVRESVAIIDQTMNTVRKEVEGCDSLQGFHVIHSLGGFTGGCYLGSKLISKLREEYPDQLLSTFSIVPSPRVSDVVVEPYNAVLSFNYLIKEADAVVCLDNGGLYDVARSNISVPTYRDVNNVATHALSDVTCGLRFRGGQSNSNLRELVKNMTIPSSKRHFLLMGAAPSFPKQLTVQELVKETFDAKNMLAEVKQNDGRWFASSMTVRGHNISRKEIDDVMQKKSVYTDAVPHNTSYSVFPVPPDRFDVSSTFLGNSSSIKGMFKRVQGEFSSLYKTKAHLQRYTDNGICGEADFTESESNFQNLIEAYEKEDDK